MSLRDEVREKFISIMNLILDIHEDEQTNQFYQSLLDKGIDQQRAIELLAFYYEIFVLENPMDEEFDLEKWHRYFKKITVHDHLGEYAFDKQDERRNLRSIQRKYGELKSDIGDLEDELFVLECHLLVFHEVHFVNSLETKKIIHVVIQRLLDIQNHDTTDFSDYVHEDLLCFADGLEQICNPYVNEHLEKYLSQYIEIDDHHYDQIFKNVFLCLARILKSIDRWDKELGKDGYFNFIEQYIDVDGCIEEGPEFFFNEATLLK